MDEQARGVNGVWRHCCGHPRTDRERQAPQGRLLGACAKLRCRPSRLRRGTNDRGPNGRGAREARRSQSGSRLRLLEGPQELSGDCHRWRAGWAAFGRAPQAHTRHAAAPFDDRTCHFGAEEDGLPGLAGRAKRHRPLHYLQPLATTVHRGSMETESQPRAVDALHGRP